MNSEKMYMPVLDASLPWPQHCTTCRGLLVYRVTTTLERPYQYISFGFHGVYLIGIPIYICSQCQIVSVDLPNLHGLQFQIFKAIIDKPILLSGLEVRFLREYISFSKLDIAILIGYTEGQIEIVESMEQVQSIMDRFIRLFVVNVCFIPFTVANFARYATPISETAPSSYSYLFSFNGYHWSFMSNQFLLSGDDVWKS